MLLEGRAVARLNGLSGRVRYNTNCSGNQPEVATHFQVH